MWWSSWFLFSNTWSELAIIINYDARYEVVSHSLLFLFWKHNFIMINLDEPIYLPIIAWCLYIKIKKKIIFFYYYYLFAYLYHSHSSKLLRIKYWHHNALVKSLDLYVLMPVKSLVMSVWCSEWHFVSFK